MSVHYKFKSNLDCDTVTFDGLHISVADLKKAIMQQKKIGKSSDFDLQITNAQTKEVYDNDETLVPKNTSVIVARVPVATSNKKTWDKPELPLPMDDDDMGHIRFDKLVKNADIANTNATEDDKVKAMILQSSQEYDPSKYVKSRSMTGPLPPTYTCHRCGKQGHWIKNCPTNALDVKRSTGIPRSFMVPVDGPEHKGALLTSSGDYAVPIIDHQAYKEVKKEKPPFIKETDVAPEPEVGIPEHLICMFCKGLLQDAVLIPCCGNSFCDECVRQALLDSDNHECPECHETDISPDTVIPNRYLRSAVLKFKNEKSSSQVHKVYQPTPVVQLPPHIESPQPSPDSTVENNLTSEDIKSLNIKVDEEEEEEEEKLILTEPNISSPNTKIEMEEEPVINEINEEIPQETDHLEEPIEETPPGTPLADEPIDDQSETAPIETVHQEYQNYTYHSSYRNHHRHYYDEEEEDDSEPRQISTIETITNIRNKRMPMRIGQSMPQHSHYTQGMHHRERQQDYEQRKRDYHGMYDRRNNHDRQPMRGGGGPRLHRQNDRYRRPENRRDYCDYPPGTRHIRDHYENHLPMEQRRHPRQQVPPPPPPAIVVPPPNIAPHPPEVVVPPPQYKVPLLATTHNQAPTPLPTPQTFPPQPPPPGASPNDHLSHIPPQPPPPGVGPLLPASHLQEAPTSFQTFQKEELLPKQEEEKSLEDRLEEFQRKLDKKASESARDRSRSSSRSRKRSRSSSSSSSRSSHSRSYSSNKSWSRTPSRSISRSSRSRSRTPYSSRSRTRSFSRTRSRSRSKPRSYTRSRSRSRSPEPRARRSRSRDRDRDREREKRRISPRERLRIPYSRNHSQSHSPSPRKYYPRQRRSPYQARRPPYNPPHHPPAPPPTSMQYGNGAYSSSYTTPSSLVPVPVVRTAPYSAAHLHPPIQQPPSSISSHPIEHYPIERTRYPYEEMPYSGYDVYHHSSKSYPHQRYEREPRLQRYKTQDYSREYPRREEEEEVEQQHIPGWIGDRNREFKPRYRPPIRDQRKDIKELPKINEPELKSEIRIRDQDDISTSVRHVKVKEESPMKKKTVKLAVKVTKHKKHHHRHSRENKQLDKENKHASVSTDLNVTASPTCDNILVSQRVDTSKNLQEVSTKTSVKVKEKKHKHKKHKTEEQLTKKKKLAKKVETETTDVVDPATKVKTKKKKNKVKGVDETKKKDKPSKHSKKIKADKVEVPESKNEKPDDYDDPNVLTVTADDMNLEAENTDDFIKLNLSNEDLEMNSMNEHKVNKEEEPSEEMWGTKTKEEHSEYNEDQQDNLEKSKISENIADENYNQQRDETEEVDYEEDDEEDLAEEENEEEEQKEGELHVSVPELSKWEREELEEEFHSRPQRRSAIVIPKDDKGSLSSEIIQRAENVIMQKPLKKALTSSSAGKEKGKADKKSSNKSESPINSSDSKTADQSPALQVTISTDKDKQRSVLAKDEAAKQPSQTRKIKLDRSSFKSLTASSSSHRTVVVEEPIAPKKEKSHNKGEERSVVIKHKHTKIHGPDYKGDSDKDLSPSSKKKQSKATTSERHVYRRSKSKEDSKWKSDVSSDRRPYEDTESYRMQGDARRTTYGYDRSRHFTDNRRPGFSSRDSYRRKSRSQSYDSPESFSSSSRQRQFFTDNRRSDNQYFQHSNRDNFRQVRSSREISPPKGYDKKQQSTARSKKDDKYFSRSQDESKFGSNYNEYTDDSQHKIKSKSKTTAETSGEKSRKRSKPSNEKQVVAKRKKETPSSSSSSSASDSEESLDDREEKKTSEMEQKHHKKAKHKKHKKHKHKKKKSHKSKTKE